ncbi:chromate transporter [Ornithinibacillus bavariensis]|uniref:Transporter YwrA n=1 Tax=Ornithinibacillus bavariensis TaxID=545502 RepID=A0A920C5Q6_9BACI|nr:chromate transporter [Ornithinibacillus bavariensis]GIO27101.1 putative transporter YwrA [Ornithinibacillus bavariensis]HAM80170.1 chromate transporter [Ornithinibacillus sp.]
MKTQWNLFLAFFRAGMLGYGGGPASIPLVHKEVVERYKWMTNEEFGDLLAIANTLPGPIATKLAGYVGYRVAGIVGLLNGVLTSVLPTVFLLNFLLMALASFREFDWVKGMTAAVIPVVGMMMLTLTWQFFDKARKGMGWVQSITLTIILFLFLYVLNIHPGIVIAGLIVLALVIQDKKRKKGVSD